MPKHPMPTRCPVTGETLEVTRLRGPTSGVVIEGEFVPNEFALLEGDALEYLRLFVKVRGNLKEVERMLGVSYPTVRARFDAMVRALGYEEVLDGSADARGDVLAALERGEIGAEEATRRLHGLQRRA